MRIRLLQARAQSTIHQGTYDDGFVPALACAFFDLLAHLRHFLERIDIAQGPDIKADILKLR